jgi:hypothetical protein
MQPKSTTVLTLAALATLAWPGARTGALAQTAPAATHEIPQSLRLEHQETLERLTMLAHRPGAVGATATKAIPLFKRHVARETEYIMPPLTLLPILADGKVTPDMVWAVAMTDRVKADRETIFIEHTEVTDALNEIRAAALRAHDKDAVEFAEAAAGDSLNDIEVLEPAVELIGAYLHANLPAAH